MDKTARRTALVVVVAALALAAAATQAQAVTPPTIATCTVTVTQTTARLCATVNPNGGEVTECKFEYGTTAFYGSSAPCTPSPGSGSSPVEVSASVTGLIENETYHYRVLATNAAGRSVGADQKFETLPNPPTVVTEAAIAVNPTTEKLTATVNPNSAEVTGCKFEWGTTESYGQSTPCIPERPGSGSSAIAVVGELAGLAPNATYHFRISATNAGGTSKGSDETFKTLASPPTVVTKAPSSVTHASATLNATVNPNNAEVTQCEFEYGTTTAYGQTAPCTPSPGAGTTPVAVSGAVRLLNGGTTYHFRISATNAGGTSTGSDQTFTTPSAPHWQKNFIKIREGEKLATISWGTITLQPSSGGSVTCKTASANNIENTATAARGETELLATYECKATSGECAAKGGETKVGTSALPWPEEINEEEGTEVFREENSGVQLNIECYKAGVLTEHTLYKSGPVGAETGTFTPKFQNGPSPARPSESVFDEASGHLLSETGGLSLTTKGKLKVVGFEGNPVPVITLEP